MARRLELAVDDDVDAFPPFAVGDVLADNFELPLLPPLPRLAGDGLRLVLPQRLRGPSSLRA